MRHAFVTLFLAALAGPLAAQSVPAATEPSFDGRPLHVWVADLKAAAPYSRTSAAYAIASMGPAARAAVPALIEALQDDVAAVRYPVAYALGEIGPGAEAAVPALEKLVDDPSDEVGFMARKALRKLGHPVSMRDSD